MNVAPHWKNVKVLCENVVLSQKLAPKDHHLDVGVLKSNQRRLWWNKTMTGSTMYHGVPQIIQLIVLLKEAGKPIGVNDLLHVFLLPPIATTL